MTPLRNTFAILFALASAAALPAHADAFADYAAANKRLTAIAKRTALKHDMPRASDPEVAKVLAVLADNKRFLDARPFTSKDMGPLMDMCLNTTKSAMSYVMYGLEQRVDKSMTDPAKIASITGQLMTANAVTYQEELIPLILFQHRCLAKELPLITSFATSLKPHEMNSERRKGLVQMRSGVLTSFMGVASTATEPGISLSNRRKVFAMMTEIAPLYVQVLDQASRKQAHNYFKSLAATVPAELVQPYRQITNDLNSSQCTGLCSL